MLNSKFAHSKFKHFLSKIMLRVTYYISNFSIAKYLANNYLIKFNLRDYML
nr:MAG TPA: hypothetical protein [Caudoviricetes sp.]